MTRRHQMRGNGQPGFGVASAADSWCRKLACAPATVLHGGAVWAAQCKGQTPRGMTNGRSAQAAWLGALWAGPRERVVVRYFLGQANRVPISMRRVVWETGKVMRRV